MPVVVGWREPGPLHARLAGARLIFLGEIDQLKCDGRISLGQSKLEAEIGLPAVVLGIDHCGTAFTESQNAAVALQFRADRRDVQISGAQPPGSPLRWPSPRRPSGRD